MANEYIRKQYAGAAVQTTVVGALTDTDTTITISSSAGWPSGATPFVVTVDVNKADEETMLVTRTGTTLTVVERGYDGTTAVAHGSSAPIIHSHDAHSDDQANRYVNLQVAKGDLVVHNGTNPALQAASFAGDGSDDGKILKSKNAEATGWEIAYPSVVTVSASAPAATSATPYGEWVDDVLKVVRWLDGGSWVLPNQMLQYATIGALSTAIPTASARNGMLVQIGDDIVLRFNDTAGLWHTLGLPVFADTTARDALYAHADVELHDGARAYTLDTSSEWQYRSGEWIRMNAKITIDENAPVNPHDGDIWLQPVA